MQTNYLFQHNQPMEPRDLLRWLMKVNGDNPNSLAEKLRDATKQPQIYKFITGTAKEPRRPTLQPIADHYRISIEAFYNPQVAQAEYDRLTGALTLSNGVAPPVQDISYSVGSTPNMLAFSEKARALGETQRKYLVLLMTDLILQPDKAEEIAPEVARLLGDQSPGKHHQPLSTHSRTGSNG